MELQNFTDQKSLSSSSWIIVFLVILLLSGVSCGLLPKQVEFGQQKVKSVPTAEDRPKLEETRKQAAAYTVEKINEAIVAAAETKADASVRVPLAEASPVALSLSYSLGAPSTAWTKLGSELGDSLNHESAKLDRAVAKFAKNQEPLVGKKIEGTGFLQIGYFTYIGLLLGLLFLAWTGLKIYGMVNPIVGLGTNVVGRVGSKVLSKGMAQVVSGGEKFKDLLADNFGEDQVKQIKELFNQAHERSHDNDVQDLIKSLTK